MDTAETGWEQVIINGKSNSLIQDAEEGETSIIDLNSGWNCSYQTRSASGGEVVAWVG